jgi:hypothetical protein
MSHGAAWHGGGGFVPDGEEHEPSGSFRGGGGGRAASSSFHGGGGGGFLAPTAGCEACDAPAYSSAWRLAFGVMLCDACRRDAKLIAKGAAKVGMHTHTNAHTHTLSLTQTNMFTVYKGGVPAQRRRPRWPGHAVAHQPAAQGVDADEAVPAVTGVREHSTRNTHARTRTHAHAHTLGGPLA